MHGTPGRIVSAFALSVADAARQVAYAALSGDRSRVLGGGGLRGGTYRLTRAGLELHDYVYLPTFKVNLVAGNGHPSSCISSGSRRAPSSCRRRGD